MSASCSAPIRWRVLSASDGVDADHVGVAQQLVERLGAAAGDRPLAVRSQEGV